MTGKLYLVATPIGNLGDMTPRAIEALREADLIAAEDTRTSLPLLARFEIRKPMTSYHEYNKYEKTEVLIGRLLKGEKIALITDAGTPAISDPGQILAARCLEEGIPVTSLPGACALITALTMSGLPSRRFCFEGFLPSEKEGKSKKERKRVLDQLRREERTMILYEAPHRLRSTLKELEAVLGGGRRLTLCRELTKKYEEALPMTIGGAISYYEEREPRGEYVLVIEGADPGALEEEARRSFDSLSIPDHLRTYLDQGLPEKEAMKKVAADRGISRRDVYRAIHVENRE